MANTGTLLISDTAALKLRYAAEMLPDKEVSGFGKVEIQDDNIVMLTDIVIPPQEVGGAHVDIGPEVRDAFYTEVIRNGCGGADCERRSDETNGREIGWVAVVGRTRNRPACTGPCQGENRATMQAEDGDAFCDACFDRWIHMHDARCNNGSIKDWRVWWHKHPGKSKPSPSGTDTDTLTEFASAEGFGFGWMIGLIISADASEHYGWLDVASGPWPLTQKDIEVGLAYRESPKIREMVARQMAEVKVRDYRPAYNTTPTTTARTYPWQAGQTQPQLPAGRTHRVTRNSTDDGTEEAINGGGFENVLDIIPSKEFKGSVEIMFRNGTRIVTKDAGQAEAFRLWQKGQGEDSQGFTIDGKGPGEKAVKGMRKKIHSTMSKHGIRWVFDKEADAKLLRDKHNRIIVGFDLDGEYCMKGEERHVYYVVDDKNVPVVADPTVRQEDEGELTVQGKLIPTAVDEATAITYGDDHIGYDRSGRPLRKGEAGLAYDKDGEPIDDNGTVEGKDVASLRRQYLIPPDVADEDVEEYATMAMASFGGYLGW